MTPNIRSVEMAASHRLLFAGVAVTAVLALMVGTEARWSPSLFGTEKDLGAALLAGGVMLSFAGAMGIFSATAVVVAVQAVYRKRNDGTVAHLAAVAVASLATVLTAWFLMVRLTH